MATSFSCGLSSGPIVLTDRDEAISTLLGLLREHEHFLVTSHARPDGDAIGSSLAAMHLLEAMGKKATVTLADPIPRPFACLPGADRILRVQPADQAQLALILECDSIERTGFSHLAAPITINIDHHQSGVAFANVNWIDPESPAVGAMIYDLAIASGVPISPELATCLYAAVLTDTLHFTLPTTTADTFGLAQHLVNLGADASGIAQAVYHSYRPARLWVLGAAMRRFHLQGPVGWSAVTLAEIGSAGAEVEDCEGVVNYIIGVEGVCAGAFLREMPSGEFRASLRSKGGVDVATVAETLGGGGHRNASGCTLAGPLEQAVERVVMALEAECARTGAL